MSVISKFKSLGIDVNDQVSVARLVNSLAISDTQKTAMLRQYLSEIKSTLNPEAKKAARFPV